VARVIVAEDSYLVREGLRELLATRAGIEVVDVCGDLDALLEAVEANNPDVVITDIRMPPTKTNEGIQAAARLR
jgi:DNA-binding NarL/FixJ family response regulator